MNSFIKFNQGLMKSPIRVQLWLMLLVSANLVSPLFFFEQLEAKVVVATMAASMVLMTVITGLVGYTRLLGAGHIFWIPLVGWLWTRLDQIPADGPFGLWVRALMVVNTISLVIDVADVIRYARGEREELVKFATP